MDNKTKQGINKLDFWAKGQDTERYYHICEGTGDNLLQEDIDEGYIDYVYYSIFDSLSDINENVESDGGMVLLKEYYQDLSLEEIMAKVEEMEEPLVALE